MLASKISVKIPGAKTPFYFYDLELLKQTLERYSSEIKLYGYQAHYALKANCDPVLLSLIKDYGLGADCVSGNEVLLAVKSGFAPDKIVFAGVGKSDEEIINSLKSKIHCFNCESIPEIEVINQIAGSMGVTASVSIRVNPDIDAHTHKYISTGKSRDKFGISPWRFEDVMQTIKQSANIRFMGLHFHIGSQITDMSVFEMLCSRVNELQQWFRNRGEEVRNINLGGGLGVNYDEPDNNPVPDFSTYFRIINRNLKVYPGQKVHFEPGRALVAQCGSLISKVLYVKEGRGKKFVILDAGMTDLIRPALYKVHHKIENLSSDKKIVRYDVVGPICESSDFFARNIPLAETCRGDLIAIRTAGAYGQVMSMRYNQRDLPVSVYSE
ncbi:MAG: diaminopimelate decarboxylase [Bacteroidales bacterium]|nr:diaminopimelate decarboxylase [Bacteroidales bacterium]MDD3988879.1 diaminopimelate decarboxylase [Bacteroidales bacterium]MDD4638428.1 diaminopimelate decarboxylase [Bacteroidales bacterium]